MSLTVFCKLFKLIFSCIRNCERNVDMIDFQIKIVQYVACQLFVVVVKLISDF